MRRFIVLAAFNSWSSNFTRMPNLKYDLMDLEVQG